MAEPTLTERLAQTLRESAARRAEEAEADQLALSQPSDPETEAMDLASDLETERMLEADAKGLERAKFTASAVVELWIKSYPAARQLALTALVHSLTVSRNAASLAHSDPSYQGEHLCTDLVLCCSHCFCSPSEFLSETARTAIVNLSRRGPLDEVERAELSADRLVENLISRVAAKDPAAFDTETEHGSLGTKLADLLRET